MSTDFALEASGPDGPSLALAGPQGLGDLGDRGLDPDRPGMQLLTQRGEIADGRVLAIEDGRLELAVKTNQSVPGLLREPLQTDRLGLDDVVLGSREHFDGRRELSQPGLRLRDPGH